MAGNIISILITAKDQASPKVKGVDTAVGKLGKTSDDSGRRVGRLNERFLAFAGVAAGAGIVTSRFTGAVKDSIDSANRYQNAMAGLVSIAKSFNQDATKAKEAAQDLAADGLMSVTDSARGLKNLLASGFNLPQAIKLMDRFKDSAAFNRQASLGFGEAIAGATEGIKNGNSILVDNAGVTKNLSIILKEAGYSAQDLMNASSDVNVRMALYRGLLKETNPMVGDAKKLAEQFAGEQAKLGAETEKTKQKIGTALQPALRDLMKQLSPVVSVIGSFAQENPKLTSSLILLTGGLLGLLAVVGTVGLAVTALGTAFAALGPVGLTIAAVATAATVAGVAMKAFKDQSESAATRLRDKVSPEVSRYKKLAADLGVELKSAGKGASMLAVAEQRVANSQKVKAAAMERVNKLEREQKRNRAEVAEASEAVSKAQEKLNRALKRYGENSPQYQKASRTLADAQEAYNVQLADAIKSSSDLQVAQDDLAESKRNLKRDTKSLKEMENSSVKVVDTFSGAVVRQKNKVADLRVEVSKLRSIWSGTVKRIKIQGPALGPIIQGVSSKVEKVQGQFKDVQRSAGVIGTFKGSNLQGGAVNNPVKKNAAGTPYSSGGLTLVGERGPELVNMPRGASVTPTYRTRQDVGDGALGGSKTFTTIVHVHNEVDHKNFLADFAWRVRTA